jgi:hypothetical protein
MKNKVIKVILVLVIALSVTGCSVVAGIFKAGMGVGIFVVIAILAIILFILSKLLGKK